VGIFQQYVKCVQGLSEEYMQTGVLFADMKTKIWVFIFIHKISLFFSALFAVFRCTVNTFLPFRRYIWYTLCKVNCMVMGHVKSHYGKMLVRSIILDVPPPPNFKESNSCIVGTTAVLYCC
jgi:hypothetical protein